MTKYYENRPPRAPGQNKPNNMGKLIYLELSASRIYNLQMEPPTKTAQIDESVESAG
jgi:hypothetical protein